MENTQSQSHALLHSFCLHPDTRVESQGINEHVLLVLRAHPITQIPWIVHIILFIILVIVLNIVTASFLSLSMILFMNIAAGAFMFSYAWMNFLSWFFNVGVVTNERIIDIDFLSVIYKEVTETRLEKVEDITSKSGGYIESFFDYGDVFIQTAGKNENIEFLNIPRPSDVVRIIGELIGK